MLEMFNRQKKKLSIASKCNDKRNLDFVLIESLRCRFRLFFLHRPLIVAQIVAVGLSP